MDPAHDSDGLLSVLRGELAGMERRRIAERTRRGREEKRRRALRAEGDGTIVGMPRGVPLDHATGTWSYVFPKAERVREARWVDGRPLPREPHERYENVVLDPPLIPREDFDRLQRLLAELRARRPSRRDPETRPGTYGGFLECGLCGAPLLVVIDSKSYAGYYCGNSNGRHGRHCPTGQISTRLADPQLDDVLEQILGDLGTLERLIEESAREAESRAASPAEEVARRIAEFENQKARAKDAFLVGAFELPELQKHIDRIDGELSVLQALLQRTEAPISLEPQLVADIVDVFSSWRDLPRSEKRALLRGYRMRIAVARPKRRILKIERLDIGIVGFPCNVALFKKMKRNGIE